MDEITTQRFSAIYGDILRFKVEISNALRAIENRKIPGRLDSTLKLIIASELFSKKLYQLRRDYPPNNVITLPTEDFAADMAHSLVALGKSRKLEGGYRHFINSYREIWRRDLHIFLFTTILFLVTLLIGWEIGTGHPELVPVIVPQPAMEQVIDHYSWFEQLQENPIGGGFRIAVNNIQVSINCFFLGALLGLGGLLILGFNGLMIGCLVGFCATNNFHEELTQFMVGHGPLELTIIISSAFASLLYGRAFFQRPYSRFAERLKHGARDAGIVILGVLPWLIVAATVECLVSPYHYLDFHAKMLLGILVASLFWIWTFFPAGQGTSR